MPAHLPEPSDKKPRRKPPAWHFKFAYWYANEEKPSKELQVQVATLFANEGRDPALPPVKITYDKIKTLKARPDFQDAVHAIYEGGLQALRALVANDMLLYGELHRWGALMAQKKSDYRAIPLFTTPILKSALPETAEHARPNIIIAISTARAEGIDDPPTEIEYEVLPPKQLEA